MTNWKSCDFLPLIYGSRAEDEDTVINGVFFYCFI